jgi:transaldolase
MNQLEQLKKFTKVVADTSDFESMKEFLPIDATTNPSLIYKAASQVKYKHLLDDAIDYATQNTSNETSSAENDLIDLVLDKTFVNFGLEILKIVPGRVSIEVDARLSFDKDKSIKKAKRIIKLFEDENISKDRILIKLASTKEGIEAAKELEQENIHCNLTLLFSLVQAIYCAENNITLISPFVGRILDYYKQRDNVDYYSPEKDPGVVSVKTIYNYFKKFDHKTVVMGASFRNIEEIIELTGCDLLTISPNFLKDLQNSDELISQKLSTDNAKNQDIERLDVNEDNFAKLLKEDEMATFKLNEGILKFSQDIEKLEDIIKKCLIAVNI